ncbi:methyltransferase domain-containing protein [Pigmentiphaga soli]|uniref:Methyltransferase domain-containing protein n=2 Tax=Pigmentiphaga soli TaxID=1007095 RepID=A0ABP8H5C7_9BURK
MSDADQLRWNRRYAEGSYRSRSMPSPFLEHWLGHVPAGRALDVACGAGRNALRLAEAGFAVDAVDISTVALEMAGEEARRRQLTVNWQAGDLDSLAFEPGAYQLITVFRFHDPALWPRLIKALAPDGWILVEHHLRTPLPVAGPESEAFRIAPGELLDVFKALRIVHYSEKIEEPVPGRIEANVRVAACNGFPGW